MGTNKEAPKRTWFQRQKDEFEMNKLSGKEDRIKTKEILKDYEFYKDKQGAKEVAENLIY